MNKKPCDVCENGTVQVPIVLADDPDGEIVWAEYCPFCGRYLE